MYRKLSKLEYLFMGKSEICFSKKELEIKKPITKDIININIIANSILEFELTILFMPPS